MNWFLQVDCCGFDGPKDWQNNIPPGCYPGKDNNLSPYTVGCKSKFGQVFWIVAGIALGILVIEVGIEMST